MKRRVLRWYDYSWSRGRIQGGGDINTALGLLPDKLKTELALHVNLSVLKKVNKLLNKIRKGIVTIVKGLQTIASLLDDCKLSKEVFHFIRKCI